ncbi:MAG: sulfatase [Pseudomonadota bacterium]
MVRIVVTALLALVLLGGLAGVYRNEIMLEIVRHRMDQTPIGPHREVDWPSGPATAPSSPQGRPPNIVFILADDLGINDISTFGGGVADGAAPTPNIDRLAASGAVFTQAYSGTSSCAPSRAMLMTGRYPTRTGFEFTPTPEGMSRVVTMFGNSMRNQDKENRLPEIILNEANLRAAPPYEAQGLPGSEVTIAEMLRDAGYYTAHIGKWHLGRHAQFSPNAQGFDDSLLMASGLFLPEDDPNVVNARLDFDPIDRFLWTAFRYAASFNDSDWFEPGGYLTDYWTDESIKVIEQNKNRPFFLYLAHWGVHTPLQATKEDYDAVGDIKPHRLRTYAAMVRSLDRSVGRILDKLEEEDLLENTIVVFTSDNGGAGYVGLPDINAPYRGWKLTLFEGGIRVPLFVSWPSKIKPGAVVDAPVAHIDLAPTLAAAGAAELPADRIIDGKNLLPYLSDEAPSEPPHERIFWQSAYYQVVREGDFKLQRTRNPESVFLYDLAVDPTEQNNISTARPDIVERLTAALDAHQSEAREPLYPYVIEGPIAIDKTLDEPVVDGDLVLYWPN